MTTKNGSTRALVIAFAIASVLQIGCTATSQKGAAHEKNIDRELIRESNDYAKRAVPKGAIIMWSGNTIPEGWALCDGIDGRPALQNRFVVGAGSSYSIG